MSLRALLALSLLVSTACRDQLNPPTPGPTPQGGATGAGGRRPTSGGASGSAEGGSGGASGAGGIVVPADGGSSADGAMGGLSPTALDAALNPAIDGAVDATPVPEVGPAGQVLFIIGPQVPAGGDIPVHERLAARLSVEVMRSVTVDRQALMDRALVVISATAAPNALDDLALEELPVPILVLEPNLLPVLEMTGSFQSDFGATPNNERDLDLVGRNHPLHAGLSGRVTVYDDFSRMTWGDPGPQAIRIATPAGRSWQTAIFAYPTGTWMVGRRAPAARVAFFIHGNSVQTLTADGAKLLDAAIDWLIRPE